MALQKSVIDVKFTGGLDSKTTSQLVPNGHFLDLVNIVRLKTGALAKRFGFTALSKNVFGTATPISSGARLATFVNDLLLIDGKSIFSYSSSNNAWANRGQIIPATVSSTPVERNSAKQAMPDMATANGLTATVWEDSRGGIGLSVLTDDTQAPLLSDYAIAAGSTRPKVVAVNGAFLVTYYLSGALCSGYVTFANPSAFVSVGPIQTGMLDAPHDLEVLGNVAVYAFNTSGGLKVGYVLSNGTSGSPGVNGYPAPVVLADQGRNAVNLVTDPTNRRIYISYHDTAGTDANTVRCTVYTSDFNTAASTTVESISNIRNIAGTLRADASIRLFYEQAASNVKNHLVRQNTVSYAPNVLTAGTSGLLLRSVGLASKGFTIGPNEYVTVAHESALQSTYFNVKQDGFVITRMQAGLGGGLTRDTASPAALKSGLTRVSLAQAGGYVFPVQVRNRLTTESATTQAGFIGINKQTLTFNSPVFNSDTLGSNYAIAGGLVLAYDGVSTTELGFNLSPEDVTATATGSGGTSAGDYRVVALYQWVDGQGQTQTSATSIPVTVTATSGQTIVATAPTLRITAKTGTRVDARVVFYRTIAGGTTVQYRDVEVANNPSVDTVSATLTATDAALMTQEILYTVGGVLNNDPPPACTVVHKHKNRLWFAGLEDGNSIGYTKETQVGEGIAFSNGFLKRVDPKGGYVSSLATLDDKLVIGKPTALFALAGDGPVDTGAQDNFTQPQLISSDIGCSNQRSIVVTPIGIMFQSNRGIYLLDRSLMTKYIGKDVERFNGEYVTSATISEQNTEVRFTTANNSLLVYNYLFETWSTFSNYAAQDACNFLGNYAHLKANGTVNVEHVGQYNDNGQSYSMRIETNWIQLGKVQGFMRIMRWSLLGDFLSHCYAKVSVGYNYESVYNEVVYFNTQPGLGIDTFGSDAHFGDAVVMGGTGSGVFQFRSKPRTQKCESIKLLIEDLDTITPSGGGSFSLVSLAMEVAGKVGLMKLGNNKTRGG